MAKPHTQSAFDAPVPEFYVLWTGEDYEPHTSLMAAEAELRRCYEGAKLYVCRPDEDRMRDITEDTARDWFAANGEPNTPCPEVYRPFVGDEIDALTDAYETGGCISPNREHSTHFRGVGL